VTSFPAVGYASGEAFVPGADRFSYFPVSSVVVDSNNRGSGYAVGQEFDVMPAGGVAYSNAWADGGGDDPDSCPNGNWYSGRYATVNEDGRMATAIGGSTMPAWGTISKYPYCKLRVSEVNSTGGIVSLEVVEGGMMYRSEWTDGVRHPDVSTYITTDTGSGGEFSITINTDKTSPLFGSVTGVTIDAGGSEYADPPSGWMWEIMDIPVGGEAFSAPARMMSKKDWSVFTNSNSPYELVMGTHPPTVPRSASCLIGDCYHSLLNRSYAMTRTWMMYPLYGLDRTDNIWTNDNNGAEVVDGWPPYDFALYRDTRIPAEGLRADGSVRYPSRAYQIIEWGFTLSLSAPTPSTCADQSDGRTGNAY